MQEKLQKDLTIDRILINGMKPSVLKSLITFIYCGGTSVAAEDMQDLFSAADYFRVPGIMSILKDKFKIDVTKKSGKLSIVNVLVMTSKVPYYMITELNLEETPPLFFSNNGKVNTTKYNYNTVPIGVLSDKCNAPGKSKEARYLLAKEQAASQLALEAVQKNKSKLIVTDETCTEVTVEAELTPDFDDSEPMQEFILEDLNRNGLKPTRPVESFNGQINEVFVLQPDNEQFVNDNNRVLEELPTGHTVSYQLISQNKDDLEIQQYICNTINDYTVNSTSNVCYDIIPEKKIQMTYAEISSAAVSDAYSSNIETVTVIENCNSTVNESYITNEESPRLIAKYNSNMENQTLDDEYKLNAVNTDYSVNTNTSNDIYIVDETNNIVIENSNVETNNDNTNYVSNLESSSVIEKYNGNVETDTENKTLDPSVETNNTAENDTVKVETVPENNISNINIDIDVATSTVDENYNSPLVVSDSQDSSSMDLSQKSDIIPVSQQVIVSDTDDEDSDKYIFSTSGHCSIMDKILPNYDIQYNDNAVMLTDTMNTANKSLLKRKYDDILSLDTTCKNDENNIQNFDISKPVKFLKNDDCDDEMNRMKSMYYSLFSVIRSQDKENVKPSNILMTENGINDQKCIYDDTNQSNHFGAESKSKSSGNDFLTLDNHREGDIFSELNENRRQTRSSAKRLS